MYIHVHVAGGFIALEHHLSVFTQGGAYMHNYACTCMCSMYMYMYIHVAQGEGRVIVLGHLSVSIHDMCNRCCYSIITIHTPCNMWLYRFTIVLQWNGAKNHY